MSGVIKLDPTLFRLAKMGFKTATTRLGYKPYTLGPGELRDVESGETLRIQIISVTYKTVRFLDLVDAQREGFVSKDVLVSMLSHFYPGIRQRDVVTVVRFTKFNPDG